METWLCIDSTSNFLIIKMWSEFSWLLMWIIKGSYEHDEALDGIKGREALDRLSYCLVLRKGFASWNGIYILQ
jgi:hypothetical protein